MIVAGSHYLVALNSIKKYFLLSFALGTLSDVFSKTLDYTNNKVNSSLVLLHMIEKPGLEKAYHYLSILVNKKIFIVMVFQLILFLSIYYLTLK